MKKIASIVVLTLILSPICWNGLSLMHYLVEHTHAFCLSDKGHQHQSVDECLTICNWQIDHSQDKPFPFQKIEYQKLKLYLATLPALDIQPPPFLFINDKAVLTLRHGRIYNNDIFHPPTI